MALAAVRPAPMARITVAAPVTASPPAKTPSRVVSPCASATMQPRRVVSSPAVVEGIRGVGEVPRALMTTSHAIANSEPGFTTGARPPPPGPAGPTPPARRYDWATLSRLVCVKALIIELLT